MNYKEIEGDLIELALKGNFDVIAHGCNCQSVMGAGIALTMKSVFGCDQFEMENWGATPTKLGNIDWQRFVVGEHRIWNLWDADFKLNEPELVVVNAYTQIYPNAKTNPFDYEAFTIICRKMNIVFKGLHIGLPTIGAGLAGGNWERIKEIIQKELKDCDVTIVIYKK